MCDNHNNKTCKTNSIKNLQTTLSCDTYTYKHTQHIHNTNLVQLVITFLSNCAHVNTHKVQGTYNTNVGFSSTNYSIECVDCGKVLESNYSRGTDA